MRNRESNASDKPNYSALKSVSKADRLPNSAVKPLASIKEQALDDYGLKSQQAIDQSMETTYINDIHNYLSALNRFPYADANQMKINIKSNHSTF